MAGSSGTVLTLVPLHAYSAASECNRPKTTAGFEGRSIESLIGLKAIVPQMWS